MKKLFLTIFAGVLALIAYAQYERFDFRNAREISAIRLYSTDSEGYLIRDYYENTTALDSVERVYAYDKKNKTAYVLTPRGNYRVWLTDEAAKAMKKDKEVGKLNGEDLNAVIEAMNLKLEGRADEYNRAHEAYLNFLAEEARKKRMEDSIREQRRLDSIARVEAALEQERINRYRATENWSVIPLGNVKLRCKEEGCGETVDGGKVVSCGMKQDTIYFFSQEELALGKTYMKMHYAVHKVDTEKDKKLAFHVKAFADSLQSEGAILSPEMVPSMNLWSLENCLDEVKKAAPYGFVEDWGWDEEYGTLTFHISYTNLNKKTIKYITVYWQLKNDVDDPRGSGQFKGTGPVDYLDTGSWEWDNTLYFVRGDVTRMRITKILLTYMNGTTKVLTGKEIKFN